jgi:predicted enzyme related to lactoylglutathione lyase
MGRVIGLGGVFFKSPDPAKLRDWYARWLGLSSDGPGVSFPIATLPADATAVWSPFAATTDYFAPSQREFMFNLIVDDLNAVLHQVQTGDAKVIGAVEEYDYGRFGWFIDPDGNKVELWQLPPSRR